MEEQKAIVIEKAFERPERPSLRMVFYQSGLSAAISLGIYFCLMFFCAAISPVNGAGGFLALAVFPLTYFSFYFLSILSEEQSEVVELKGSFVYTFFYLITLRMLYVSIAAVLLNISMLLMFFRDIERFWSIGAAGTTSMLLLALITLYSYEKTDSVKISAVLLILWIVVCIVLMNFGQPLYHLLIDVIPLAVHIVVTGISFLSFVRFVGKVELKNAYGF